METRTASDLASFRARVEELVHRHPVVVDNAYTRWFAQGEASAAEVRHLAVQFSVFSHLFVEAQLRKVINAADIESYRAGKEILMNELGVVFRSPAAPATDTPGVRGVAEVPGARGVPEVPGARGVPEVDVEPDLVGTEGTVDGGRFRFAAAHFEWLLRSG